MARKTLYPLICILLFVFTAFPVAADSTTQVMPQLTKPAKVVRDKHGIAHIYAKNEHDLFFLQGYTHAEDRLFQMDVSRRRANGTLAELLGAEALQSDVLFRTIGLHRAAQRSLQVYSQRALAAAEAYSAGVNAYVAAHPLPPEYIALEITQFAPWRVQDVAVVIKLITFGLSFDMGDISRTIALRSYQQAGATFDFDGTALYFDDLFRSQPFDPASTVPDAHTVPGVESTIEHDSDNHRREIEKEIAEMCEKVYNKAGRIPYLKKLLDNNKPRGSNQWAISGALTENGLPLLANDPHLELSAPSTFYPIHLKTGKMDVIGSGFAGVPSVVVGHNKRIAWGTTVNRIDVVDYYQEQIVPDSTSPSGLSTLYLENKEAVIAIPQVFRTNIIGDHTLDNIVAVPPGNGIPEAALIVPRRNQGPIIEFDQQTGIAISVQYTGFSATRELDSTLMLDSSRNLNDFVEGLQYFDAGSQNFVYADVKGNIAYFSSAELPVREDLQAGIVNGLPPFFIRNGQGGNEWLPLSDPQPGQALQFEIIPFREMPQTVNPPRGWMVNANNDPAGVTLDNNPLNELRPGGGIYYLHSEFQGGFRAGRITHLITQQLESDDEEISFEDMQKIQADTVMRDAEVLTPYILQAFLNAQSATAHPALARFAGNEALAEAVKRLSLWDYSTPTGITEGYDAEDESGELRQPEDEEIANSIAATLYSVWRGQVIRNVIDSKLLPYALPLPDDHRTLAALRNLLENYADNQGYGRSGINFFMVPEVDSAEDRRDIILLQSLANALNRLSGDAFATAFNYSTDQNDYRWGRLHRLILNHVLGEPFSIPSAGGAFPHPLQDLPGIPTDGGFQVVDASPHTARAQSENEFMFEDGPVNRFVAEAGARNRVKAQSIWPGGTNGVLGHHNYLNMLPLWLNNETIPLGTRKHQIKENAQKVTKFKPGSERLHQ